MKNKQALSGFTLIELLVVVLIIGILAAVALPKYQKAVEKTRIVSYVSQIQTIVRAEQAYYFEHGEYTSQLDMLDIDVTKICSTLGGSCSNELYNCPHKFGFNIPAQKTGGQCSLNSELIVLKYCPNSTSDCSSGDSNYTFLAGYSLATGKRAYCLGDICSSL